jgi:WhiB family redox-sensing transcriptional regulator
MSRRPTPRVELERPKSWRDDAACKGHAEVFYPISYDDGRRKDVLLANQIHEEQAKAICSRCPVRDVCLQDAMDDLHEWGVRGGSSEAERNSVRRRQARMAAGVDVRVRRDEAA